MLVLVEKIVVAEIGVVIIEGADVLGQFVGGGINLTVGSDEACGLIEVFSEEGTCQLSILKDAQLTAGENPAVSFHSSGKFLMEDGCIQAKKDAICVTLVKDRVTELSITGGSILSEDGQVIVFLSEEDIPLPQNFITGGTFDPVPREFIPQHSQLTENEDGSFSVISTYTLTFLANGGAGSMEAWEVSCGDPVTLPKNPFTAPDGKDFAGWEINGTLYAPGDTYQPFEDTEIKALWKAHQHSGGSATCMAKAVCAVCGRSYGSFGSHILVYTAGYAPSCTDTGMNAHSRCTTCGGCFVDGIRISASALTISAPGHDWETVEGASATCLEDGVRTYRRCNTCQELQIDGKSAQEGEWIIPAPGHMLEEIAAVQATCKGAGIQAHTHCTVCDGLFLNGQPTDMAALTTSLSAHILS